MTVSEALAFILDAQAMPGAMGRMLQTLAAIGGVAFLVVAIYGFRDKPREYKIMSSFAVAGLALLSYSFFVHGELVATERVHYGHVETACEAIIDGIGDGSVRVLQGDDMDRVRLRCGRGAVASAFDVKNMEDIP